ncbi:hypothetical protein [Streptomyces sp. 900105755]
MSDLGCPNFGTDVITFGVRASRPATAYLSARRTRGLAAIHGITGKDGPAFRSATDESRTAEDVARRAVSE